MTNKLHTKVENMSNRYDLIKLIHLQKQNKNMLQSNRDSEKDYIGKRPKKVQVLDAERDLIGKRPKNKLLSRFWTWTRIVSKLTMPNAEADELQFWLRPASTVLAHL